MKRRLLDTLYKDPMFGTILVIPLLVWVAATLLYPLVEAVNLSIHNVGYLGTSGETVGLSNYMAILRDGLFWQSASTTLWWTVLNTAGKVGLAFIAALVLNQQYVGRTFVRNWIVLPWVFPSIVLATMGKWFLDPTLGLINYLLVSWGILDEGMSFLGSGKHALYVTAVLNIWRWFPFFTVIFLAALQTIPDQLHEASRIDGANRLQILLFVDIPMMSSVIKVSVLIASLWSANIFDLIWLLTRGGPSFKTTTLPIFIYLKGFQEFRISLAAAAAVLLFIALLVYGAVYFKRVLDIELEE